jgi:hypothetical protein
MCIVGPTRVICAFGGGDFILILTLYAYWVCVLFGLHVIINILGYFLNDKWPLASFCILIAALLIYHVRISTYFSVSLAVMLGFCSFI